IEPHQPLRVAREQIRQHLDRHVTIELRIAGAVHLAHAARAKQGLHLVRTQACTGCERHRKPRGLYDRARTEDVSAVILGIRDQASGIRAVSVLRHQVSAIRSAFGIRPRQSGPSGFHPARCMRTALMPKTCALIPETAPMPDSRSLMPPSSPLAYGWKRTAAWGRLAARRILMSTPIYPHEQHGSAG